MPDCLSHLVETFIGSLPVQDSHLKQWQERQIIDLCPIHHSKPFSSTDHMCPQPIVKEKVWEDVIPPVMVCSHHILPFFDDPVKGILGDLKNPPQYFFDQKWRGRLPHELLGSVPNQTMECAPFCWNAGYRPRANLWSAGWSDNGCALQRLEAWWWDVACWLWVE